MISMLVSLQRSVQCLTERELPPLFICAPVRVRLFNWATVCIPYRYACVYVHMWGHATRRMRAWYTVHTAQPFPCLQLPSITPSRPNRYVPLWGDRQYRLVREVRCDREGPLV